MRVDDLEHFRNLLVEREQNLVEWLTCYDPSNHDCMHRVQSLLTQIKEALARIEDQTYGRCTVCDGEVELHRLEVQPTTEICLACISDQEKELLQEELNLASRVHRALLPQTIEKIDGFEVAARSLAAHHVGGDYYDFLSATKNGLRRVVIADTMGKGLPAGLIMSNMQGALRILAEDISFPSLLITRINRWLCRNIPVTRFISLACVGIQPGQAGEAQLTFASAGHCPAILIRDDGSIERLEATGPVLGVHEDLSWDEQDLTVQSGDLLVLYTDGVTEAEDGHGEMFEEERLVEYIRRNRSAPADDFLEGLISEVTAFTGRRELSDDLTAIVMRKL